MPFLVLRNLLDRRVPQILGLYLGASWVIVEFVGFLVDRFLLSPHLIGLSLVVVASVIPTVVLLAYYHGMPGPNEWATVEKIVIPVNLFAATVLVGFMFMDKQLGAATTTLVLENEEGRTIERVIPKSEFRKKVAIFNFENQSGDSELHWLQRGIPFGLGVDMDQDLFVSFADWRRQQERLESAGHPDGGGLPVMLTASIAEELRRDYFIRGSFTREDDTYSVTTSLYETRRRKLLAENTFSGDDVLELIDEISLQLRRDLEIPERHIEESTDLRVADVLTHSREAFRLLAVAEEALVVRNGWGAVLNLMERAVAEDPTSATSQYFLSVAYLVSNRKDEADEAARRMMEYIYRMPERWQYAFKYYNYNSIVLDAEKRLAVVNAWVDIFPEDIEARSLLAAEYDRRQELDKAVAQYERILELSPSEFEYLERIGDVFMNKGEFERALGYYERYADAAPDDHSAFHALGAAYCWLGEHETGKSHFQRALIIDPDNVEVMNSMAIAEFNLGHFDESRRLHEESLEVARSSEERARAYNHLSNHHVTVGQLDKAIEYKQLAWAEQERLQPPAVVLAGQKVWSLPLYAEAGRAEEALEILSAAESELAPPLSAGIPLAKLNLYVELKQEENAEAAFAEVQAWVEQSSEGWARDDLLVARGRIYEMRGECEEAIESYRGALELAPMSITLYRDIGRCYRMLGQLDKAEAELKKNLKVTRNNPRSHHEIALVYAEKGERQRAIEHLRLAVDVWSDADPDFALAQAASAKIVELEGT